MGQVAGVPRGRWIIDYKDAHVTEVAKGVPRALMLNLPNVSDTKWSTGTPQRNP